MSTKSEQGKNFGRDPSSRPPVRYAVFSDVHANLEALQAILEDAKTYQATQYICLGDIVGYNANPHECVEIVQQLDCPTVKGNHDELASMDDDLSGIDRSVVKAITWAHERLTASDKLWLSNLKLTRQVGDFTIVHTTLDAPHKWGYVFNELDAAASFNFQHTQLCFFGHTHSPRAYVRGASVRALPLEILRLQRGKKYLVNVGSVGQPRDGDWRAAYCLYTPATHEVELRRVEYVPRRPDDRPPGGEAAIGKRPRFGPKLPGPLRAEQEWPTEE
jgi:predicted phosphodiesterase